jgi:hypothetical protein
MRHKLHKVRLLSREIFEWLLLKTGLPPSWLIKHDMIPREPYALGVLLASVQAQKLGLREVTIIELGVGGGGGMLNLCKLCALVGKEMGLKYQIIGFDSGQGLPDPQDYRDHPEIWKSAQFTHDVEGLKRRLSANARVLYGDVGQTIPLFAAALSSQAPVAFVSLDLDYYSSSKAALNSLFAAPPEKYLPAVVMYVDDIDGLLTYNDWCGEALAIREFNAEHAWRKIERKPVRAFRHPKFWHRQIFCAHILDHPVRNQPGSNSLGGENEINILRY